MQYRFTLDKPYKFSVVRGYSRMLPKSEFRPQKDSLNNTYREPVTGLVMLRPNFFDPDYHASLFAYADWRKNNAPNQWLPVKRSTDGAGLLTMAPQKAPTGGGFALIELLVAIALIVINQELSKKDTLVWVAESNVFLEADESFVWHYNTVTDQMCKKHNWFGLQWDNIKLHFSMSGDVRVYQYDRANMMAAPTLIDQFNIASPTSLLGKDGYFWFLPIPGLGLLVQHTQVSQSNATLLTSSQNVTVTGHLILLNSPTDGDGNRSLFQRSQVRVAFNPFFSHVGNAQRVTFAPSGTYSDAPFDPGFKPSHAPDYVNYYTDPTGHGTLAASLLKPDLSGAWEAGTDRQGRVQVALSTGDTRWSPFLYGYEATWNAVIESRDTTPVYVPTSDAQAHELSAGSAPLLGRVLGLEYSLDEYERFEGKAECLMEGPDLLRIARRGDATFLLEGRTNDGAAWEVIGFGLAEVISAEIVADASLRTGSYYAITKWQLRSMHHRFTENRIINQMGFDSLSIRQACDRVLNGDGFAPLRNAPKSADDIVLQGINEASNTWKYAPKTGEDHWKTLCKLCFHLHTQAQEYYLRFDYAAWAWDIVARAKDSSRAKTWRLTPDSADQDEAARIWWFAAMNVQPQRAEANVIGAYGLLKQGGLDATNIINVAYNNDSLYNKASVDYLGRAISAEFAVEEATTKAEVDVMIRRIYDRAAHRREQAHIEIPEHQPALKPNVYVILEDSDGNSLTEFLNFSGQAIPGVWIKSSTVRVEAERSGDLGQEAQTLQVDSIWESEMQ